MAEVNQVLERLVEQVGNGKSTNRAAEDQSIAALKGLANAKYLNEPSMKKIAAIATDKSIRPRIRVAAIEALPGRCSSTWTESLLGKFADQEEDSEIRIKIYLALVACPSNAVANGIKTALDVEQINQVGSFVTSHLRNLRASADPSRESARAYLGQIKPKRKFPDDVRKFSFNNELSYTLGALGLGSSTESNVIYSQSSFVPRSVSLNLTTELFGRSFNFLQLDARAENLDRMIEHVFGPKGLFSNNLHKQQVQESANGFYRYVKEHFGQRARRDVNKADLDKFARGIQLPRRNNEITVDDDLDVDLSIKLFGAELAFLSYAGSPEKISNTPQNVMDKIFGYANQGFEKLKSLDHECESHVHFLDAEIVYPTNLGVGLNLGLIGSSVVRTKISAKIDINAIMSDPKNALFKLALEPSASVELVGEMGVSDGFGTQSGIRIVGNLHTATGYDLNVHVLDGKGIDISLGVPKRKQEILAVSSDVLYSSGNNGKLFLISI